MSPGLSFSLFLFLNPLESWTGSSGFGFLSALRGEESILLVLLGVFLKETSLTSVLKMPGCVYLTLLLELGGDKTDLGMGSYLGGISNCKLRRMSKFELYEAVNKIKNKLEHWVISDNTVSAMRINIAPDHKVMRMVASYVPEVETSLAPGTDTRKEQPRYLAWIALHEIVLLTYHRRRLLLSWSTSLCVCWYKYPNQADPSKKPLLCSLRPSGPTCNLLQ